MEISNKVTASEPTTAERIETLLALRKNAQDQIVYLQGELENIKEDIYKNSNDLVKIEQTLHQLGYIEEKKG